MNWIDVPGFWTQCDWQDYEHLINWLPQNGFLIEIGSFRGRSLASVAETIKRKNLTVWAVDIFDKVISPEYVEPSVYAQREDMFEDFKDSINLFGLDSYVTPMPMTSIDGSIACAANGKSPDMVFIDADHSYEAVIKDIESWTPLVKDGGIISGHDYDHNNNSWKGVYRAVHEKFGQPYFGCHIWSVRKSGDTFTTNF